MRVKILAIAIVFCCAGKMQSQIINDHAEQPKDKSQLINVWLDTEGQGDTIELIRIMLINNSGRKASLSYRMVLQRKLTDIKTDTQQGTLDAAPGKVQMIAKIPLQFLPEDEYRLDVEIYDPWQRLVDQDSLVSGSLQKIKMPEKPKAPPLPEPEAEIGGLVIDLTRSKQGRDFFELFYQQWSGLSITADGNITIEELPARGLISRISVSINEQLVFQRFLTPRANIVEENARFAVEVVSQHFQNNESLNRQLQNEDQQGTGIY
ncbi:MAG: CsgE family curli-type amyloid fiber assembly protein [Bacteroidota bacterium]